MQKEQCIENKEIVPKNLRKAERTERVFYSYWEKPVVYG